MDDLRWILLFIGAVFIVVIYLISKNRNQQQLPFENYDRDEDSGDIETDWDDVDEDVTSESDSYDQNDNDEDDDYYADSDEDSSDETEDEESLNNDLLVLYVIAKYEVGISGASINSAAQANQLIFGDQNIFHRRADGETKFSMANMLEPGSFDPNNIHELVTPGVTLFMQLGNSTITEQDFNDMMECAYHLAEMLDAKLCNESRQPISNKDADELRARVIAYNAE